MRLNNKGILVVTIYILTNGNFVSSQLFNTASDIQSFLNQFCIQSSNNEGCRNDSIIATGVVVPPVSSVTPQPPTGPTASGCFPNEKRCPQLQTKCVPNEFDCNLINSGITCRIPQDYGVEIQVLLCGDDTPVGVRCGNGVSVPVLTVLLVQCQGSNQVNPRPVSSLNVLIGPGDDGGAGVYLCSASGSWEPKLQSPNLNQLMVSCRNAGCGRVPHPSDSMPVYRRWSWVRAIYKDGQLRCTGTLVSQNALITAAHCVTRSPVDTQVDQALDSYQIELPGPNFRNRVIKITPERIQLHPRYRIIDGNHHHDMAVIFFQLRANYHLPTVCIADREYRPSIGKDQVVFDLKGEQQGGGRFPGLGNLGPRWNFLKASWDFSCISTATRFNGRCSNTLKVQPSQFCASHTGASLTQGSSGGPYLVEVGEDVEEIWVLMGVLSLSSRITDGDTCFQEHSTYGQVADETRWLKDCVFDGRCTL